MKKILLLLTFLISVYSIGYAQCIPNVTINSTPSGPICSGMAVTFTATPTNGGTPSYKWTSSLHGILSSTASTYTSVSLSNGEVISVEMTSSLGCASPTTAMSSITMNVYPTVNPYVSITADKPLICMGQPVTFTASPTNGGLTPTYQWSKNAVPIPSATNSTYTTTGAVNGDSYAVQMTSSLGCAVPPMATSPSIVITVTPIQTINITLASNVPGTCMGNPVEFTSVVSGSGSTPAPTYEWFITSASTPTAGVSQGAPSTTATTFTTSALTATNNKVYVKVVSNAACASSTPVASNVVAITTNIGISPGTIGPDQTICYNTVPEAITQLTAPTGIVGTPTYQWEASLSGASPFAAIAGATNATFTPTVSITQDIYIRRVVTDLGAPAPCNVATSNVVHISVRPQLTAGTIGSDETKCSGAPTTTITETNATTGGIYTYQWQSSFSGTFANIPGATNSSYNPGPLTTTKQFRLVTSSICGYVISDVVTKTIVAPGIVTASINDPGQICEASPPITFIATVAATGPGTVSFQWFLGTTLVGTNSPNYTYTPVIADDNKEIKVVVTKSNGCNTGPATSNLVTLNIDPCGAFSTTIAGPNPITAGQQNAVYSVTNQTGFTYTWSITGGTIVSGQNTNSVTVDWDAPTSSAFARTTATSHSISVLEKNTTNQTKTTTTTINTISTGIAQSQAQSGINVFPNPTTGLFNIEMPESGVAVAYEILDVTGRSVASGAFTSTGNDQQINADFGAGMYQVVLKYNNVVTCVRLSKVQ